MANMGVVGMQMIVITLLLAHAVSFARAAEGEIHWYKDLDEAMAAAQQSNRPIMIDFWADWCGPCRIMDAEVYTDPALIAAFREKMIGVRIHFDLQPKVVRQFNVPALPYLVFTDSHGTELLHHRGMLEAADITAVIQAIPADLSEINRLDRALQEDKNHFPSLRDMGQRLRELGFYEASNGFFEQALRRDEAKSDAMQRETILYSTALNSLALRDGKAAASALERCLKEFPHSARRPDFLLALGRAYLLQENRNQARRSLDAVIAEFPQSSAAAQARELLQSP